LIDTLAIKNKMNEHFFVKLKIVELLLQFLTFEIFEIKTHNLLNFVALFFNKFVRFIQFKNQTLFMYI